MRHKLFINICVCVLSLDNIFKLCLDTSVDLSFPVSEQNCHHHR